MHKQKRKPPARSCTRRKRMSARDQQKHDTNAAALPLTPSTQHQLAARLLRLLEAEIRASELAVSKLGSAPDPERTRTLGALARALQAANSLSEATRPPAEEEAQDLAVRNDPAFRSVEELGRAISRHLDDMERERARELHGETEAG
jgi:hypothetical protein